MQLLQCVPNADASVLWRHMNKLRPTRVWLQSEKHRYEGDQDGATSNYNMP